MTKNKPKIQLRIDDETWIKFKKICNFEKSLNEHIVHLIKEHIQKNEIQQE